MSDLTARQIILSCGKKLGFAEFGNPNGRAIFYCHGFPASRLEGQLYARPAFKHNVRLIVLDRPGYGLSDPKPALKIAEWPDNLIELADFLEIDRFCVLGVSGGGPYALACAFRIPIRILSVGVVCGLGPVNQTWARASMKWPARLGFFLGKHAPLLLPIFYGRLTALLMSWRPEICQALLTISAPESDRIILKKHEIISIMFASLKEALKNGAHGSRNDFVRYANDWGFALEQVAVPIHLWHGTADAVVPIQHAYYLEKALPIVIRRYVEAEGHFSLPIRHMDEIFEQMIAAIGS